MTFERFDNPEDEAREAENFLNTLGPLMLVSGYDSVVSAVRDAETGAFSPAIIVRFSGRENQGLEVGTASVALSPEDTESLVQMLAEQAVMARSMPLPEPGSEGFE